MIRNLGSSIWRIDPVVQRIRKHLIGEPSLLGMSTCVHEVCPEEWSERPAAYYLDGELGKVKAVQEETNFQIEMDRIQAGNILHGATTAYQLKNALLINGVIYSAGGRIQKVYERESLIPQRILKEVDSVAIPSSIVGNRYFGHFISEDICTGMMAQEFSPVAWVAASKMRSNHALRYLELNGLPKEEIRTARLINVWLFEDFAMNSHKQNRLHQIRENLRGAHSSSTERKIFFRRRGAGAQRGLVNEEAIERCLEEVGFEVVDITTSTVDYMLDRVSGAQIIVGVEGSALMHGILSMADAGSVICIQPPYRFNNVLKDHADALGLKYGFVVGEGSREEFSLDSNRLLMTIEKILFR